MKGERLGLVIASVVSGGTIETELITNSNYCQGP